MAADYRFIQFEEEEEDDDEIEEILIPQRIINNLPAVRNSNPVVVEEEVDQFDDDSDSDVDDDDDVDEDYDTDDYDDDDFQDEEDELLIPDIVLPVNLDFSSDDDDDDDDDDDEEDDSDYEDDDEEEEEDEEVEEDRDVSSSSYGDRSVVVMEDLSAVDDGRKEEGVVNRCEIDGLICSICFEAWTSGGQHQISCLPCGHIYGLSCIKKWLLQRRSSGKCPQCNQLCTSDDVRVLYASRLCVADEELHKRVRSLEAKCAYLEQKATPLTHDELINQICSNPTLVERLATALADLR